MVTIMAHPVRLEVGLTAGGSEWLTFFEADGGTVQVFLGNLPTKVREGLIALTQESGA